MRFQGDYADETENTAEISFRDAQAPQPAVHAYMSFPLLTERCVFPPIGTFAKRRRYPHLRSGSARFPIERYQISKAPAPPTRIGSRHSLRDNQVGLSQARTPNQRSAGACCDRRPDLDAPYWSVHSYQ